jgi:hypothetical protein
VIRRFSLVRKLPELSSDALLGLAAVRHPPPRYPTGALAKYARLVGSAATGARVGA